MPSGKRNYCPVGRSFQISPCPEACGMRVFTVARPGKHWAIVILTRKACCMTRLLFEAAGKTCSLLGKDPKQLLGSQGWMIAIASYWGR